jgi:hypothetical protein
MWMPKQQLGKVVQRLFTPATATAILNALILGKTDLLMAPSVF